MSDFDDDDEVQEEKKGPSQEERLEALFNELGSLKKENASLRQDVLRLALTPTPRYEPEEVDEGPDLKGLPDFNMDPDAHMKERDKRIAAYAVERANAIKRPEQNAAERNDKLWKQFQEAYPDLSKDEERIEIAIRKAVDLGKTKGYDMEKYMYMHSDVFFEDIAREHDRFFGKGEKVNKKTEKVEEKEETSEEETNRAWGIFGGYDPSTGKSKSGAEEETLGSMTEDIKSLQKRGGISW